ncbi:MAG: molybdopterin-dependent oxidoreductase [Chitinophagaceae bacterium]|jgi:xanthine dehydrogenase large subunit|nr:molybdopterin-dependent oxidoreductase [Chitinophagaceae bacterium]MBP6047044.1 molybdopterin-dependent oxidoreductase [Ferruginibacter sp.]NMD28600.1 molybdopterin-dependent oxidoreductase [Bacteroidota bacterium]MBK7735966.1 molybdopterin-dependent oxidoreductase [Chitinophagaceae bacterium]MBK8928204.1 molybdopterin-dependent oxidoreductase [Chitinophagaceae bacterium]
MRNIDSYTHTRGESVYLDDIPEIAGTLNAAVYGSPEAHGIIKQLHLDDALAVKGVVKILTNKDIPGKNQIGGIVKDEPLLADGVVHFNGMPVAIVVAENANAAHEAVKKIKIDIEPLPVVTLARVAQQNGALIVPPRTFKIGDSQSAFAQCKYIFEGIAETNGQEHLYIETQGAYAIPAENGAIKIYSSTQGPTAVQKHCAEVLDVPMHKVEIDTTRLGGGFGGKEDQATAWAIFCGLAAYLLGKPVKYSLHRMEDMRMTGKRNPYTSDFKIGLDENLKIIAYEAQFYQNAGASADLSPAVLERTLFHCTNSYFIPNVTATAYCCRTNLVPNTAFRGFGGPQGMFVIEAAIAKAAEELGVDASEIQKNNLLQTGDEFSYRQKANSEALACWNEAEQLYHLKNLRKEVKEFNDANTLFKKGVSLMPICFGISFTKIHMNQARALVHVYMDGSVNISTGAVEMGQGVNTKMLQVAATVFSIHPNKIKINSTNTYRIANTSPSAASATADLNGMAVLEACSKILERIKNQAAVLLHTKVEKIAIINEMVFADGVATGFNWDKLVMESYLNRISLSEHGHYSTPTIHFDTGIEKGHPFAYHVYGTAITKVTVDCLRGIYTIDEVNVVHDVGTTMNPIIDKGQLEGGLVQGIGWMTMEEIVFDEQGKLRSNALSTYKVPDIYSVPQKMNFEFLKTSKDNLAIFRSKAVGEPPLMYGIGAFFAIRNAVKSFNPKSSIGFLAPITPEKVLLGLYQ